MGYVHLEWRPSKKKGRCEEERDEVKNIKVQRENGKKTRNIIDYKKKTLEERKERKETHKVKKGGKHEWKWNRRTTARSMGKKETREKKVKDQGKHWRKEEIIMVKINIQNLITYASYQSKTCLFYTA